MYKICAFGDSVMKGIVEKNDPQSNSDKYIISDDSFVKNCSKRLGITVSNFARFGGTVTQGIKLIDRYKEQVSSSHFTIIEYGGNDCSFKWSEVSENPDISHNSLTVVEEFISEYSNLLDKLISKGTKPLMLSLPMIHAERYFRFISQGLNGYNILKWLGGDINYIDHWHEMYNMAIFNLAFKKSVPVIDITSGFLAKRNYGEYLCSDGVHPNERGHALIADTICDYVNRNGDFLYG